MAIFLLKEKQDFYYKDKTELIKISKHIIKKVNFRERKKIYT